MRHATGRHVTCGGVHELAIMTVRAGAVPLVAAPVVAMSSNCVVSNFSEVMRAAGGAGEVGGARTPKGW